MMPKFSVCNIDVVLAGKNIILCCYRYLWYLLDDTCIIHKYNNFPRFGTQSPIQLAQHRFSISPVIHAFGWLKYCTGRVAISTDLKHLALADFQITIAVSLPPAALANKATVILCFAFYPPLHWAPCWQNPWSGRARQKQGVSSRFQIFSFVCSWSSSGNLSFQGSTVAPLTLPDSDNL